MSDLLDHLTNAQVLQTQAQTHVAEAIRLQQAKEIVTPPVVTPPASGVRKLASGVRHEYATMPSENIDHRAILLMYPGGFFGLHYEDGRLYKMLPSFVNTGSQPRWRRGKSTVFRYLYLNELREYDVANDQSTTIRRFEVPNINGMGESDTSEDDDHIVLCSGQRVFVYEISSDKIIQDFVAPAAFDNLYLTSQNEPIVGYFAESYVLHRRNGKTQPMTTKTLSHMDTCSDSKGNPVIVYADGWRDQAHIVLKNIDTGKQSDILTFDWSLEVHVSTPDHATFAVISTFDKKNPNSQMQYANENLKVGFDGTVTSLGKHHSDVSAGKTRDDQYRLEPHTSVSPDASRFVFDSNGDVYLGVIP